MQPYKINNGTNLDSKMRSFILENTQRVYGKARKLGLREKHFDKCDFADFIYATIFMNYRDKK